MSAVNETSGDSQGVWDQFRQLYTGVFRSLTDTPLRATGFFAVVLGLIAVIFAFAYPVSSEAGVALGLAGYTLAMLIIFRFAYQHSTVGALTGLGLMLIWTGFILGPIIGGSEAGFQVWSGMFPIWGASTIVISVLTWLALYVMRRYL
jgi:hypothetical protein